MIIIISHSLILSAHKKCPSAKAPQSFPICKRYEIKFYMVTLLAVTLWLEGNINYFN
jgi:hypothetical protein